MTATVKTAYKLCIDSIIQDASIPLNENALPPGPNLHARVSPYNAGLRFSYGLPFNLFLIEHITSEMLFSQSTHPFQRISACHLFATDTLVPMEEQKLPTLEWQPCNMEDHTAPSRPAMWSKPALSSFKCYLDYATFFDPSYFDMGICFRDSDGGTVSAHTSWFPSAATVLEEQPLLFLLVST
ncbi:unnamed protein product [Trifolium pratense]|uniref:Uncharacterized protein n=1 Tax=Trifolium pratense TaxID=57577 RepID=A0ACB0M3M1_TRIPR|nr:unnamed protein product [Trifolium pratense]